MFLLLITPVRNFLFSSCSAYRPHQQLEWYLWSGLVPSRSSCFPPFLALLHCSVLPTRPWESLWGRHSLRDQMCGDILNYILVVLNLCHRYLPAKMELFWWLLLLHKSCMRLVADRWIKLFYDEFQFGNGSQSRRKCLHSTPSQRREILDWTQWPKCGGLLCVDKQRNKQI